MKLTKANTKSNARSTKAPTPDQLDWWIAFDTLRSARMLLESAGRSCEWMDCAIATAKDRANV